MYINVCILLNNNLIALMIKQKTKNVSVSLCTQLYRSSIDKYRDILLY